MFVILIFCSIALFYQLLNSTFPAHGRRINTLMAAVCAGALATISVEALSLARLVTQPMLILLWGSVTALCIFLLKKDPSARPELLPNKNQTTLGSLDKILLIALGAVITLLGIIAFWAPPNNWDSMTTHMARVAHWMQDKTLANYPSSTLKQLNYPPGSAILILHLFLLNGSDRLANMVQWACLAGSIMGISLIVQELGAGRREQILAGLLTATIPLAILEASSTQNDQVVTFWLVAFIALSLRYLKEPSLYLAMASGLSLGLACNIKGTGYIFAIPYLAWLLIHLMKNNRKMAAQFLMCALAGIFIINAPYFFRNISLTGTLIPPIETQHMLVQEKNPATLAANILKNSASHLATTNVTWNKNVEDRVNQVLEALHVKERFGINSLPLHEDHSASALHLILIYLCLILLLIPRTRKNNPRLVPYALATLAGFLCFAAIVNWTPYNTRYHLPWLALSAPVIVLVLSRLSSRLSIIVVIMALFAALPWLLYNTSRPVLGPKSIFTHARQTQYFNNIPGLFYSSNETIRLIKQQNCRDIGLIFAGDAWEYPLWVIARQEISPLIRIEHINVDNPSGKLAYPCGDFHPCAIISLKEGQEPLTFQGQTYVPTSALSPWTLLQPQGTPVDPMNKHRSALLFSMSHDIPLPDNTSSPIEKTLTATILHLKNIRDVNMDALGSMAPEIIDPFTKGYQNSLLTIINGIKEQDIKKVQQGLLLFKMWQGWISAHPDIFNKAFNASF